MVGDLLSASKERRHERTNASMSDTLLVVTCATPVNSSLESSSRYALCRRFATGVNDNTAGQDGRLAQWESASLTRKRSEVQIL